MTNMTVKCITPLTSKNTLSSQLMKLTGSGYNTNDFHSDHDPSKLTAAGVIVKKDTGDRFFVPFKVSTKQNNDMDCVRELYRITRFSPDAVGGYQWGDTPGPDGNFGKETLDKLIEFGLASRTGGSSINQLGGTWPEVRVTELGLQVSKGYAEWVLDRHANPTYGM
jgi:hypothetical protein